ncbi:MAG: hypothetical protein LBH19_02025 [Dysgonamonadaceae bacterium]|jgi:hypothetical protein|nr:hypothetical protein [Dysgonamonadaceae bacterium]
MMKKVLYIWAVSLFCLSLAGCGGCSKQPETSWLDDTESEYYEDEYVTDSEQETGGNAMESPVEMEVPQGVTLAEAGREVYSDLVDLEDRYNLGGVKLCAEMSADRQGRWSSSFWQPTSITFRPPEKLHLKKSLPKTTLFP